MRSTVAAAVLVMSITACASSGTAGDATSSTLPDRFVLAGVEAPLVGGSSLDGDTLRGEDLALWFWTPW